jgi:hypothetical protein
MNSLKQDCSFLKDILAKTVLHCENYTDYYQNKPCKCSRRDTYEPIITNFELVEKDRKATLKGIPLDGVSPHGLALKPDHFGIHFFTKGMWNKSCDYIILTEDRGQKYAVFIELKSSVEEKLDAQDKNPTPYNAAGNLRLDTTKNYDIALQLNSASALFDYLECIARKTGKTLSHYERRFAVVYEKTVKENPGVQGVPDGTAIPVLMHKQIKAIQRPLTSSGRIKLSVLI